MEGLVILSIPRNVGRRTLTMSSEEVNLVAILYPKPERAGEVCSSIHILPYTLPSIFTSGSGVCFHPTDHQQLSGLLAELTKKVLANEPDTLTYHAFSTKENSEIIVVERYGRKSHSRVVLS